jgi:hypothetical protein
MKAKSSIFSSFRKLTGFKLWLRRLFWMGFPVLGILGIVGVAVWLCSHSHVAKVLMAVWSALAALLYFLYKQHLAETQLFKQVFTEFNKRYDRLDKDLVRIAESNSEVDLVKDKPILYKYFNLCAEEHLFNKGGYIDSAVWESWSKGMGYYFSKKHIRDVWDRDEDNESYYGFDPRKLEHKPAPLP